MKKEMLEKIKNSKKPLLVTGDMLSGKTNNVLFPIVDELIKENQNLFLVDTKGEYLEQFYEKVKSQGYRVKIIDLAKWTYGGVHHFNPLTGVSQDISDQLFHTVEKHDYELGIQVKTIFNYICNYIDKNLRRDDEIPSKHFWKNSWNAVYRICSNPHHVQHLLEKNLFASYFDNPPSHLNNFTYEEIRRACLIICELVKPFKFEIGISKNQTFTHEMLYSDKTAIFCLCNPTDHKINEIVNMLIQWIYKKSYYKKGLRCHLILDDFMCLDEIVHFNDILRISPKYDLKFYLSVQSKEKLSQMYGDELFRMCDQITVERQMEVNMGGNIYTVEKEPYSTVERDSSYITTIELQINKLENKKNNDEIQELMEKLDTKNMKFEQENFLTVDEVQEIIKKINTKIMKLEQEASQQSQKIKKIDVLDNSLHHQLENKTGTIQDRIHKLNENLDQLEDKIKLEKQSKQQKNKKNEN